MDESVVKKHHWTYAGLEGPDHWPQTYQHCGGKRQSPIDIVSHACEYDSTLPDFQLSNFDALSTQVGRGTNLNFTNNGHAASVRVTGRMFVEGGGLPCRYRTAEFHFHWGSRDDVGSEHAIGGIKYPLEMHVVNYAAKYDTLTEAVDQDDGLAVLGVLFQISDRDNPAFEPLAESLQYIHKAGEFQMVGGVRLRALLPKDTSRYYRYNGSLTTPKCFETVTWTIFEEPQKISARQLGRLRDLLHENGHYSDVTNDPKSGRVGGAHSAHNYLVDNWRPVQDLHGRIIKQSFPVASPITGQETKDAGLSFTPEPALPTPLVVPATTQPLVSSSPIPMTSSSLPVASSPKPEASPIGQLATTTDAGISLPGPNPSPYNYKINNPDSVADPSVELFHSGFKPGAPPTVPSFKTMTEYNDTKGRNTVLSGAARKMQGIEHQRSVQSTGSKDPLQAVDTKTTVQPPLPVEDDTQNSSTTVVDVPGAPAGSQQGFGSGGNTQLPTSVDITSGAQPSTPVGHQDLHPLEPLPPSSTDVSTTLVPGEQRTSTVGAPSHSGKESTTRTPDQPFAGVSSPNQDNGQQVATAYSSSSAVPRASVRLAPTPVSPVNFQELARRLRRMLVEKQRLALNTTNSSSTPLTGRGSTLHPAFDVNNQQRAWQQQQRTQLQAREQRIRQQRINQLLLKQRRFVQQQQGLSGAHTEQPTRNAHSSTPAGVQRGSIRSYPQPSSNPQTLSEALGSLRSTFYGDAIPNHITSGAARVRNLARTINPGAQSVGITPQLVPAYRLQGERTILPSVGASRATPYVFLHTYNQPIRIRRPFYANTYQHRRQ